MLAVNLRGSGKHASLPTKVKDIFDELAPYMKRRRHVAFSVDEKERSLEGRHASGDSGLSEVDISVPQWPTDEIELVDTYAKKLHQMTRQQRLGFAKTLGEAVTTEGMACLYAERISSWRSPYVRSPVTQHVYDLAKKHWDSRDYEHGLWFSAKNPFGKWAGSRLGYRLAKRYFKKGFDLEQSLSAVSSDVRSIL